MFLPLKVYGELSLDIEICGSYGVEVEVFLMDSKRNKTIWGISLLIVGIATIINSFSSLLGIELPDILVRLMGIIMIFAIPLLVYSSIKTLINSKNAFIVCICKGLI